ncbi:hypothetical protein [Hydrogenophaga pseudoflava]|uniref:hypothetical protein n=1 Tax=Hydrogenophaga pseudoflava TaxID=47421 RepID=UPI0027E4E9F1|nr:hypothetical protein [Hydrogenophaga pseudoflava]MDQ7744969.1 hypothetical protein [Hydrogenophaga pseudoflava]
MHPDLRRPRLRRTATAFRTLPALGLVLALAACNTPPRAPVDLPPPPPPPSTAAPEPGMQPVIPPMPAPEPSAATRGAAPATPPVTTSPLASALLYADRLRTMGPGELAAEQAQIGEPGGSAERQMQLALVLSQTHVPVDTARALGLLQRVAASNAPEALELRPLARLLAGRLHEARRLEDQADRLAQQLRESQRRIDVLNDRLEAMRAIERSLTPRAPASGGARPSP